MKRYACLAGFVSMGLFACNVPPEEAASSGPAAGDAPPEALGERSEDIVGGWEAIAHQYPWQARVTAHGQHRCGGSLIHQRWVLTAAHCVEGVAPSSMQVVLGDHDASVAELGQQARSVTRALMHPNFRYVGPAPVDDIALVELAAPADITRTVQLVALQSGATPQSLYRLAGWGLTAGNANASSAVLMSTWLPVVSQSQCNAAPLARDLYPDELCAGYLDGSSGGCHGDSGGPLLAWTHPEQVGIVSWGRGGACDTYTVFTRVAPYVPWVTSHTGSLAPKAVQMTWAGNLTDGYIRLHCRGTGETVSGPTNIDGIRISLECPDAEVEASCGVISGNRTISDFSRTINGTTQSLPYGSSSAVDARYVNAGDRVRYDCSTTD